MSRSHALEENECKMKKQQCKGIDSEKLDNNKLVKLQSSLTHSSK
jgi:hypothetical protein